MLNTKHIITASLSLLACTAMNTASAELFVNPAGKNSPGTASVSGFYGTSELDYKVEENGFKIEISRTFIGATVVYGVSNTLDFYGTAASISKSEINTVPSDGSGTALAFGLRGKLPVSSSLNLQSYAQYLIIDEDFDSFVDNFGDTISISDEDTTLSAGVTAIKDLKDVKLYGSVELILSTDTDAVEHDSSFPLPSNVSLERDDTIGFRLGAQFKAGNMNIDVSTAISHESGIMIGASMDL